MDNNLEYEIKELIAEILEVELEDITLDAHFIRDLGMDSMMALEVLASLEKKYQLVIPEETLPKFINLSETISIVQEIIKS